MLPKAVWVELVELESLEAEARGNRVFGVRAGETGGSFEVPRQDFGTGSTFLVIGVMEGIRAAGAEARLVLPGEQSLLLTTDGSLEIRGDVDGDIDVTHQVFDTWPKALEVVNRIVAS